MTFSRVLPSSALGRFFCGLSLCVLTEQVFALGCTATSYTYTDNGTNNSYSLNAGESLKINTGTYTGAINNFSANSSICVETGASFIPSALTNTAGLLTNYGITKLQTFAYNQATTLDNYGLWYFMGGLNFNGSITLYNRENATMTMMNNFQLSNGSTLENQGLILAKQDLNTSLGTSLSNQYRLEIAGNFNPGGSFINFGRVYAKKFMNTNATATVNNYCTLLATEGFNNNAALMSNWGSIVMADAAGMPSGLWQNNMNFFNSNGAKIAGKDFTNNASFSGSGGLIFSGETRNQGAFTGDSINPINFYDETPITASLFDNYTVIATNTFRAFFARPTELDAPATCTSPYKILANLKLCPANSALQDQASYGSNVTANNVDNPTQALGALDNAASTASSSNSAKINTNGVLTLDLGKVIPADSPIILSLAPVDNAARIKIEVSLDGIVFTNKGSFGNTGSLGTAPLNQLARVVINANGGGSQYLRLSYEAGSMWVDGAESLQSCNDSYDYGDAPSNYGSAAHKITATNLYLGETTPDAESASIHSIRANGDLNDEDGPPQQAVGSGIPRFSVLKMTDMSYSTLIRATNQTGSVAKLSAWIDFDKNGSFDADERALVDVPNGANNLETPVTWASIPTDIKLGTTYVRLRLTTDASAASQAAGIAPNGEVEDFVLAIHMDIPPNSPNISISTTAAPLACQAVVFEDNFNDLSLNSLSYWGANRTGAVPIRSWTTAGGGVDTYAQFIDWGLGYGTSIYFGNGAVRSVSPSLGSGFSFDAQGKLLTPLKAVALRDTIDDLDASGSIESHWGVLPVSLSRSFPTVVGKTYRLYFSALREAGTFLPGIMRVDAPGGSIHFKAPASTEGLLNYAIDFTATSSTSSISFVNYGHFGPNSNGYCNVLNGAWCTVDGLDNDGKTANELSIDNVKLVEAACATGGIGGYVYQDTNLNNTYELGTETTIPAITVRIYDEQGTPSDWSDDRLVASQSSLADGHYLFQQLDTNASYRVELDTHDPDLPSGFSIGTPQPLTALVPVANGVKTANFGFDPAPACLPINGTAVANASRLPNEEIQFTYSLTNQKGAFWGGRLDLSQAFDYKARVYLGNSDAGADGMTFTLQNTGTNALGQHGSGLGSADAWSGLAGTDLLGISPSLVIELDTYGNGDAGWNDPLIDDHLAVYLHGNGRHNGAATDLAGPIALGDIEDNIYHDFRITWQPTSKTLNTYFDGIQRTSTVVDLVSQLGTSTPYWGYTAATGAFTNRQAICNLSDPSSNNTIAITGKVFEDVNYGGGAGRASSTTGALGVSGARVELYAENGSFLASTNTDANGQYTFSSLNASNYFVRVVNSSVKSTRLGSNGTELGVQTFRTDGKTASLNEVGGRRVMLADTGANTSNQTLNTTSFLLSSGGQVQSVQAVTVASSQVSGVDFGFNFDTVVNTNDSGQGSLRQFILNTAVLAGESGLAQAGRSAGKEHAILELTTSDPNYQLAQQYWRITLQSELPLIGDDVVLDGSTQAARAGFSFANRPTLELNGSNIPAGSFANGLRLNGVNTGSTIKYLAINRFEGAGIKLDHSKNNLIEANYIGTDPIGVANNLGNTGHGINVVSSSGLNFIQNNRIVYNRGDGIAVWNFNGVGANEAARISSNSIYANLGLGIDLADDQITLNDLNDADSGANGLLNFPVLQQLVINDGNAIVRGCAPAGALVEFFEADVSAGGAAAAGSNRFGLSQDYGEGQLYLGSMVEGSAADVDNGNCNIPAQDGHNHTGMKAFQFSVPTPASLIAGDTLTATATLSVGTSEFGPTLAAIEGPPPIGSGSCAATGGSDILFIVDNSGSISELEYADFSQTIQTVGSQLLVNNPQNRIAVAHFGGPSDSLVGGGQYVYIERDFSTTPMLAPVRQFALGGAYNASWIADHLAGAIQQMRYALDGQATTLSSYILSPIKETSRNTASPLQIILMTDANRYLDAVPYDISMLIDPAGSGAEPDDGSAFTVYNQMKAEGVSFSVVSFNSEPLDIAASAAIASVGGGYTGAIEANPQDPQGSQLTPRRYVSVTSGFQLTSTQLNEIVEGTAICSSGISGTIFEDTNYGGGLGRPLGAVGTIGIAGAVVEVYDATGDYIASVISAADGKYKLPKLPDADYWVRVVDETVNSSRLGSNGSEWAVLTYRTDGSLATTNQVGGNNPNLVDAGVNTGAATLNTTTFLFSGGSLTAKPAQSVQRVTLAGSSVQGVDFGFNFSTVVNTNDSGQGSLRQFLFNNKQLAIDSLAQALPVALAAEYPAGTETSIFMIPATQLTAGEAQIKLTSGALSLERANTALDGRTQLVNIGSGKIVLANSASNGLNLLPSATAAVVRDLTVSHAAGSGVMLDDTDNAVIERVRVLNNNQYGISLSNEALNNRIVATTIAQNTWAGIAHIGNGLNNTYSQNSIYDNGGLGIDLGVDGVSANDKLDSDTGPNKLLNYPVVEVGSSISSNGTKVVAYDFDLDVPTNTHGYRLEFFRNTNVDNSKHGEGEIYLGYVDINHAGGGSLNFKGSLNANQTVPANANIAVTLTEKISAAHLGSTSEFSGVRNGSVSVCTDLINGTGAEMTVNENSPVITYLEATDDNGNPITYVISGGADGSQFIVQDPNPGASLDCQLLVFRNPTVVSARSASINKVSPLLAPGDYEAPTDSGADNRYDLKITATVNGQAYERPITVGVQDVNELPVIINESQTEMVEGKTGIALNVESFDPDLGDQEGTGISYAISGGSDRSHFKLNPKTGELSFIAPPDFEKPIDADKNNIYALDVRVMDDQGLSSVRSLKLAVIDDQLNDGVALQTKALLQGAYLSSTGLMQDSLRTLGLLPMVQPYSASPFNYSGTEQLNVDLATLTGKEALVDWVLIELREAANPTVVVASKAGLIQRDGDVIDASTGSAVLHFPVAAGNYFVSLQHRNHLGVRTATAITLAAQAVVVDFSQAATPVAGTHARLESTGLALLWAGDANQDGRLIAMGIGSDTGALLNMIFKAPQNINLNGSYRLSGYLATDLNMDGATLLMGPSNDANILLGNLFLFPSNKDKNANYIAVGGLAR